MGPGLKQPDWRDRLEAYLAEVQALPFSWATHNCITFTTGAAAAMTGRPITDVQEYLQWTGDRTPTRRQVLRYMHHYAGGLEAALVRTLEQVSAQRRPWPGAGDIILARINRTRVCGICLGRRSAFVTERGVEYTRPASITGAWRIA